MRGSDQTRADCPDRKTLHDSLWRLDDGFSSAIALAFLALISVLLTGLGVGLAAAVAQVQAQLVADTAALTAVDTLIGAVAGYPCENAELIALSNGANLIECRIVGLGAQIELSQSLGFLEIFGWAEAGL